MRLAVLFALDRQEVQEIEKLPIEERWAFITEEIEETYFGNKERCLELAKAWEGLHFVLGEGVWEEETLSPAICTVFGGEFLLGAEEEADAVITFKNVQLTAEIAEYLSGFRMEDQIRQFYGKIPSEDYSMQKSEDNQQYLIDWAERLPAFYQKAAQKKRSVLFTVAF
ncbi:DUF1877 family protein [Listeria costaricensis]|uniref:DUF1877 family protein n=1 Tax=Listeria costaricensis TaxID=2026604 RepID=UPI0013C4BFE4|nr:DUF1877 family protein [Listeria costaricensis]